MKISLIGMGKMGKTIYKIARERGHEVVNTIDDEFSSDTLKIGSPQVAIEFTTPSSAVVNIKKCIDLNIPVVVGTTGWYQDLQEVQDYCFAKKGTLFYASNFSIGVNLFLEVNRKLSKILDKYDFNVGIEETHHIHKKDKPSGTAIQLAEETIANLSAYDKWSLDKQDKGTILINSIREKEVPGIHEITYENETDVIRIHHEAKSRIGFAIGAVLASEWVVAKKGVFTMRDFIYH